MASNNAVPVVALRRRDVEHPTKLSRRSIYSKINQGEFPKPFKLFSAASSQAVRWNEEAVNRWLAERAGASCVTQEGGAK